MVIFQHDQMAHYTRGANLAPPPFVSSEVVVGSIELIMFMSGGAVERRTFDAVNALRANLEAFADAMIAQAG
jgi:hypothetical protein